MDSTCNLIYAVKESLRKGITRCNNIRVEFRSDVFRKIFGGKGREIARRKARYYNEDDFDKEYFSEDWHKCYNAAKECCYIDFPIAMHSYVKFSPPTYTISGTTCKKDFKEMICISLVKK